MGWDKKDNCSDSGPIIIPVLNLLGHWGIVGATKEWRATTSVARN